MLNPKSKTRLFVKALSVVLIQVFFLSNVVLADAKINQSYAIESTLATYTEIPDPKFQEKVMAMEAVLMHPAENHFLKEQIKKEQSDFKAQYKSEWRKKWTEERTFIASIDDDMPEIKGLITNDVAHLKTVKIIRVNDVLKKTGQFAHVGLVEKDEEENSIPNGMPVIYVDNEYYEKVNRAVLKHEVDEIIQWEQLRFELTQIYGMNFDSTAMRSWIIDHAEKVDEKLTGECRGLTSVEISKKFHEKAFSLDDLLKEVIPSREELSKYVDFNYIKKLYALFKDEEGKDVNISASVGLATTPTMEPTYQHYKRILPPGTFGDQLVFGTSGIREIVKFLMDKKCYAIADGLIYYFTEMGEITLAEGKNLMAIAGDLRPSTDRITLMQIASAIKHGFKVINGGNIPTPAIVNYGMYNPLGAMISLMVTASHCPVLPKNIEQNGIKPNRTTGEVLKEDERRILKQVREALEIECMKPEKENMFGKLGMRKKSKLSEEQKKWLEKAREILDEVNTNPAEMYVERNELFGKIFDETDKVPFIEHMSVGRDIIKTIFDKIGINYFSEERNKKWKEKLVVDTEDVRPGLEDVVKRTVDKYAEKQIKIKGICTVDGDADRPALFTEDGTFIYGDKTGYLTCEYIRNLESMKDKKMFVAVTATVSRAVVQRLKDIGCEVAQVKIGSPYVVKAMEDRLAKAKEANEEIIVCGFERNGGFLLGSDIMLDSGKVLKALPTRDAMLPIIAAFHLAKQNNMTLGQLVDDRFSGQYASFSWSGLVQATDLGCEAYTATMGQAIMRSFSPVELDTIRIEFLEGAKILYTKKGGTKKTVTDEDKLAQRMNPIKTYLEGYFNEKRGFKGGITKMEFLDGVRIFFANGEVVHLRPSGNAPQWRIYSEATNLKRAKEITDFKMPIYPEMIKEYLKEKKKYEGMRIVPRSNYRMKQTFEGVEGFTEDENVWETWSMDFGSKKEHHLDEDIVFGQNGDTLIFGSKRTYDVTGELKWLPKKGYNKDALTVSRHIAWVRTRNVLICLEEWSDGRKVKVEYKGFDAWLELGRGLDKNIPMGKFADMPFPVMSDRAKAYFVERGIYWLDLFDVVTESDLASEPPMWAHNFNFEKPEELKIPSKDAEMAVELFKDDEKGVVTNVEKGHKYVIRYNKARLKAYQNRLNLSDEFSPESILDAYVTQLRLRVPPGKDPKKFIDLQDFNGKTKSGGDALITVVQYDGADQEIGTGNVDLKDLDKTNGVIRIIGILNIAMAASNIPDESTKLSDYIKTISYIQNQYKLITQQHLDINEILKEIINIPNAEVIPFNRLREYYELTLKNLYSV